MYNECLFSEQTITMEKESSEEIKVVWEGPTGRADDQTRRERHRNSTGERAEECERKSDDDDVEMLTRREIKETYKRRYPDVPEGVYDTLIIPDKRPNKGRHIKLALEMMKERNRTNNKELRELMVALSHGHLHVHDLIRDGTE